jgi:integrase
MRRSLQAVAEMLNVPDPESVQWHELRAMDVIRIRERLVATRQAASVNRILSGVRGVMRECLRIGFISPECYLEICEVSGVPLPKRETNDLIKGDDIEAAIQDCIDEKTDGGFRDAAILALIAYDGLKRSEIAGLDVQHARIRNPPFSIQIGDRSLVLQPRTLKALGEWLDRRGFEPGPLFLRLRGRWRRFPQPLTTEGVYYVVRKRLEKRLPHVSPEDLRFRDSNHHR